MYSSLEVAFYELDHVKHNLSNIYEGVCFDLDILEANHINPVEKELLKCKEVLYDTWQLFRKELCSGQFQDWKDADDWLFSNLNVTEDYVLDIYRGRDVVYTGSCKKE